ncbi:hypothetical protein [Deinococcus peraridilitoris]|uniref:Uncharacterized protein n=1 Tax=Deinococcus peraridilitoris (strain DSM 19664 / LMG 22246 / CIP 109416 / KR-200) TaxID=937777 RepID=K9ZYM9_DEIPD|nr:hypothetical protein [Deinococcus peraridilitoris]AFZ66309.1 hypothetical protein Deipe_0730 [Deinococcus peraridilitoris DSM 19664]
MSDSHEHDPAADEQQPSGTGGFTGKHARDWTPQRSEQASREMAELEFTPGEDAVTEHADKTHPPEGKPSKPA